MKAFYTQKIQRAIDFAGRAHQGQKRKSTGLPYIMHPMAVALILARIGAGENAIVAGLLHDVIEDTKVTKEEIELEFGLEVASMVSDLTEQDKSLPWDKRKRKAMEHIPHMGRESLLAKSADVLCNMTTFASDYRRLGEKMFAKFSAPKEKQLIRFERIVSTFEKAWKENPLLPELRERLRELEELWT